MKNINTIPKGLLALFIFTLFVSAIAVYYITPASDDFKALLVPHVGWTGLFFYIQISFFTGLLIIKPSKKARQVVLFFFILFVNFGVYSLYRHIGRDNYNNPYLTYGMFRPVWDFLIPLVCMIVLSSKSLKRYADECT